MTLLQNLNELKTLIDISGHTYVASSLLRNFLRRFDLVGGAMTNHVLFRFFFPSTSLIYHFMEAITTIILNFQ